MLYSSLNSLRFAYDALTRVPGGDFGGYRTRMNDDIAAAVEVWSTASPHTTPIMCSKISRLSE